jgi:hypothetical protein
VSIWLLIGEKETLDEGAFFELYLCCHLLHIENSIMLIELVRDLQVCEHLEAFLPVCGNCLCHVGII